MAVRFSGILQLLNEKRTASIETVTANDDGTYQCKITNSAGRAEKTFNVNVILKPGKNKIQQLKFHLLY